jgi:hypothetical protein
LFLDFSVALLEVLTHLSLSLGMQIGKELVVGLVSIELDRVLVVSEESVVTVGKVSKGSALKI